MATGSWDTEIGIHDNFFDLGGHSLKTAQLFFELEAVFGRQLPLATLFQAPTIAELAATLVNAMWVAPWQSLVAIQPHGKRNPLFMVPGVGGNILVFAKLARLLGNEQPLYGLQARGLDGKEAPFTSVSEMAAHYVDEIVRMHPNGPYLIGGVCTGGLIAYEMARQLRVQDRAVTIFMLDTWHPIPYARDKKRLWILAFMPLLLFAKVLGDLGYPYLQKTLNERYKLPIQAQSLSPYPINILFTSQWIVAPEIQNFIINVSAQRKHDKMNIGLLFKPHPYDKNDYSFMKKYEHITLISKYEDTYKLFSSANIHSTVYSTSGLEAIAFGIPNIFVDIFNIVQITTTPYIVTSPIQFTESVRTILEHYQDSVSEVKAVADLFFTPSPEEHFKKFFTDLSIL